MVKKNNKNNNDEEKLIHEKLSEEYYKPENLWVGRKAIKKLNENTGVSKKKKNQILVSTTSVMASPYPTSKDN